MPLKYKYKTKDEVPAALAEYYAERDVQENQASVKYWVLQCEGAADKAKLDEFRDNNIRATRELEEIKGRFDGIDPEEARKLLQIKGDLEAEKLLKKGEVDKIVDTRTKAMKDDYDQKLTKATTENSRLMERLTHVEINQAAIMAATKRGLRPTAHLDITARARQTFRLSPEGKPVAMEPDGKTPRFGKDGATPLTIEEWVESQATEAPHLFEPSSGGGAGEGGGAGGGAGAGIVKGNPFKKGSQDYNLTNQMKLMRTNPVLARQLAAQAGVKLPDTGAFDNRLTK